MYIDTHAHLFFEDYSSDLAEVLSRAGDAGVERIVVPGTDLATSRESVALAERFEQIYAAVGFHPHEAAKATDEQLGEIEQMCTHEKVVAIGEIGLDFHYDYSPRDKQQTVFEHQIGIAARHDLPIIIHTREAERETLAIIEQQLRSLPEWRPQGKPRGVFHCFPGDVGMARTILGWNFFLSIPGPVTFPAKPARPNTMAEVVTEIPIEHVLLETDSPYLTPVPFRGRRNEPSNIPLIAQKIADLRGQKIEEVAGATTKAARMLFGIDRNGNR